MFGVVAVHETGGCETALFGSEKDTVDCAEETGVVGRDEEDEGGDQDRGVEEVAGFVGLDEAAEVIAVALKQKYKYA